MLCFVLTSCNDAPTQIGTEFLQDTLSVYDLTENDSIVTNFNTYSYTSPLERNTGITLVGIANNYKAATLMRFSVPVDKKIQADSMISCQLFLILDKYAIGDTNSNQLNFEIKEVTSAWDLNTTSDAVLNGNMYGTNIATWNNTITRKDTMDTIIVDFPKQMCADWLQKINDGYNITDTVWGIGLLPKAGCNIINGFAGSANSAINSFIRVIHQNYSTDAVDTFSFPASDNVSFVESKEEIDLNFITVQAGVRVHSSFDIDISALSARSCVNSAEIILHLDESKSSLRNNLNNDTSLWLAYIEDTTVSEQNKNVMVRILGLYDSTNARYVFQTFGYAVMNYLLRQKNGKGKLILMCSSPAKEHNCLDKWVFYSQQATDANKRPKIKLQTTQGYEPDQQPAIIQVKARKLE